METGGKTHGLRMTGDTTVVYRNALLLSYHRGAGGSPYILFITTHAQPTAAVQPRMKLFNGLPKFSL